ncbi:MAG: pseudouridine synthase, partial [Waterburya sp.]
YHLPKTYLVDLDRPLTKADLKLWSQGIKLDGRKTLPAKIRLVQSRQYNTTIEIVLTEGRNRQIRRVAKQLGYQVLRLHRLAIGSITLNFCDNLELPQGQHRHLEINEVNLLKNSFNLNLLN